MMTKNEMANDRERVLAILVLMYKRIEAQIKIANKLLVELLKEEEKDA